MCFLFFKAFSLYFLGSLFVYIVICRQSRWAAVIFVLTGMTLVQSTIKLKVKEKKEINTRFYTAVIHRLCESQFAYRSATDTDFFFISIVNRAFLWEWTYQNLMKLFSLSPYLLLCCPQGIILACLRNSTQAPAQKVGHFESQQVFQNILQRPSLWVCGKLPCNNYKTAPLKCSAHPHLHKWWNITNTSQYIAMQHVNTTNPPKNHKSTLLWDR